MRNASGHTEGRIHDPSIMKKDTQQGSVRRKHILIFFCFPVCFKLCVQSANVFVQLVTFLQAVCLCSLYISQLLCSVSQFLQSGDILEIICDYLRNAVVE
jgi:hypothetical protein